MSDSNYFKLAMDKVNQNDFESSIELFNKAIKKTPNSKEAHYHRGVSYLNLEKIDLAIFDFNKLIELDPNYAFYYSCRAFAKSRLGDKNGAIEDYKRSLKLDPTNEITLNNLGLVQEELGFMDQAKESYAKSDAIRKGEGQANNFQQNTFGSKPTHSGKIKPETSESETSKMDVAKSVFTNKSTFKEFLNFIKNGFKLKKN